MSNDKTNSGPAFPCPDPCNSSGMSLRQYAAIKLRVPDSGEEWLDDMIRKSLRDEFAGKAMASIRANERAFNSNVSWEKRYDEDRSGSIADYAYYQANAMLKAREQ